MCFANLYLIVTFHLNETVSPIISKFYFYFKIMVDLFEFAVKMEFQYLKDFYAEILHLYCF